MQLSITCVVAQNKETLSQKSMNFLTAMKWGIVCIACLFAANILFRLLQLTLDAFFGFLGFLHSFAQFSAQSMTASGIESISPKMPHY
jgi:hypothetical protein